MKANFKYKHISLTILCGISFGLCLTSAEYVNCQHVHQDEFLDFFGINGDVQVDVTLVISFPFCALDQVSKPFLEAFEECAIPSNRLTKALPPNLSEITLATVLLC